MNRYLKVFLHALEKPMATFEYEGKKIQVDDEGHLENKVSMG